MGQPLNLLIQIQEIQCDSKIGKSRHFIAADRKERYSKTIGVSVMIIGVFIGSTVIKFLGSQDTQKVILSIVGFLSASLAGVQTFFNFSKAIENHRKTGNLYLDIARDADNLLSKFKDTFINKEECQVQFDELLSRYKQTTKEEEICPNSDRDYEKAYKKNKVIKDRLKALKEETLYAKE